MTPSPSLSPSTPQKSFWGLEAASWAASGAFIRTFQLALQKKPVLGNPLVHLGYASVAVIVGYQTYRFQNHAESILESERMKLVKRRLARGD